MMKTLLLSIVLIFIAGSGCVSTAPESLIGLQQQAAHELLLRCRTYYFWREPKLVYPDPQQICGAVYSRAVRGKPIPEWKM